MKHRMALIISGLITAFVMVVAVGLVALSGQATSAAQAQAPEPAITAVATGPAAAGSTASDRAEIQALQQQVVTYRSQLQQAYSDLQQAYDQIQALQASNSGSGDGFGDGERGRRAPRSGQSLPFGEEDDNG
jgi:hypothetical protein